MMEDIIVEGNFFHKFYRCFYHYLATGANVSFFLDGQNLQPLFLLALIAPLNSSGMFVPPRLFRTQLENMVALVA